MSLASIEHLDGGVAVLRLDRPEARNAINTAMLEELLEHLSTAAGDEELARVLVVSSTDPRGLSAGADVREELDRQGSVSRMELFSDLYEALTSFPRATVAACHGDCVGGGAEIAVSCDLRVAGDNLRLRFPGAALGVPVGPARLATLCGLAVAKDLLFTSRTVEAEEAHRLGLVQRLVPAEGTEEAAIALAREIAAHPPAHIAQLKRHLHDHDGIEERTREEGRRQVEWARTGPGLSRP